MQLLGKIKDWLWNRKARKAKLRAMTRLVVRMDNAGMIQTRFTNCSTGDVLVHCQIVGEDGRTLDGIGWSSEHDSKLERWVEDYMDTGKER